MAVINGIDIDAAARLVETVKNNPELGKTMWRARATWQGGFRAQAQIRQFSVAIDEPPDLGGTDTAPNPVELVLGALGGCLIIGYVLNASVMGIEVQKVELDLEGDIDLPGFFGLESDVLPGYTNVRVNVVIKSSASSEQLDELHSRVISTSPVGLTLSKMVNLEFRLVKRRVA